MSDDVKMRIASLELRKERLVRDVKIAKVQVQASQAKLYGLMNQLELLESELELLKQGQLSFGMSDED